MRLAIVALAATAVLASASAAAAQSSDPDRRPQRGQSPQSQQEENGGRSRAPRIAPLRNRANAGPCPFVKILYDAARYVELNGGRAAASAVGYTGEIEGVTAGCSYRGDDPITVQMNILFNLGRGPQAAAGQHTYRYWIAVTERNQAVLAKEYFDLPVTFDGTTASMTEGQTLVIPRATAETSGGNFEVLVGFDVTPEMAEFNRSGSRFRINAGAAAATPPEQ